MADSDPRNARQSRQAQPNRAFQAQEDPLAEVARMVSEENAFTSGRREQSRPIRDEGVDLRSFSADLEAELLQELEASFAPRTPPRTSRAPAALLPEDAAEDLIRSIEEQLSEFERTAEAPPRRPEAPDEDAEWTRQSTAEDAEEESLEAGPHEGPSDDYADRPAPGAPFPQDRQIIGRAREGMVRAAGDAAPRQHPPEPRFAVEDPDEAPQQRGREQRRAFARQPRRGDRHGNRTAERREVHRLGPTVSGTAAQSPGWRDRREDDDDGPVTPGLHQPRTDDRPNLRSGLGTFGEGDPTQERSSEDALPVELAGELEASFSDPSFGDGWHDNADEPRVAAVLPGALPRRLQQPRNSRRGLAVAAGVLGVAVIGGAAALALRAGDLAPSGPPPVIAAPDGAVKVSPPQQASAGPEEAVGEAVYDRVAGGATEAEERIVDSGEEPEEISRIVVAAPEADAEGALASAAREAEAELVMPPEATPKQEAATGGGAAVPAGPRRVRTFVVRPDGSIAPADEVAAVPANRPSDGAASPEAAVAAAEAQPIRALPVATTRVNGAGEPESPAGEPDGPAPQALAALEAQSGEAGGTDVAGTPEASAAEIGPEPAPPPSAGAAAPAEPDAAAEEEPSPIQTGAVERARAPATAPDDAEPSEPVDLLSAAPPTEAPAPATPAAEEGWIVQVSSQRTREEAESSWNEMRERYASVLGSLQPSIQRADLGEKGVYHRVRVGPWPSRAEAVEVCEALKAAGASCFVAQ